MVQTVLWTLRHRRYATLAAGMLVLALGCIGAGTWQIQRFRQSVHDNDALRANAHAAVASLTTLGVPLTGAGGAPGRDAIRFRTVTTSGTYLPQVGYLGGQIVSGTGGYYAVSPLRTSTGILLVVRGFVADRNGHPSAVDAPPAGRVTITGRLDTTSSSTAANPAAQARALGAPVYQAVLKLLPSEPGGAGLTALPKPDLSNPAGGAYEAQHFAYIVQWYIFAIIALCAPFLIARNEVREAQRRFLGVDTGEIELGSADEPIPLEAGPTSGAELAIRPDGTVARAGVDQPAELIRAKRLADRYGRALSMGEDAPRPTSFARRRAPTPVGGLTDKVPNSADVPHRSHDSYQGAYNDYLWQLGLADGDAKAPEIGTPSSAAKPIEPVIVDVEPAEDPELRTD